MKANRTTKYLGCLPIKSRRSCRSAILQIQRSRVHSLPISAAAGSQPVGPAAAARTTEVASRMRSSSAHKRISFGLAPHGDPVADGERDHVDRLIQTIKIDVTF